MKQIAQFAIAVAAPGGIPLLLLSLTIKQSSYWKMRGAISEETTTLPAAL